MIEQARILSDTEFRQITVPSLENERTLVRDVHYTIHRGFQANSAIPSLMTEFNIHESSTENDWSGIIRINGFPVSESECVYFFEESWPLNHDEFLDPKDIIPSGLFALDVSQANKKKVLSQLIAERTCLEIVDLSEEVLSELAQSSTGEEDNIFKLLKDHKVKIPINNMETLHWAIYAGHQRILRLLGTTPIMFTKELKRSNGKIIERYNCKLKIWERIPGIPKFPKLPLATKLKSIYFAFRS